MAYTYMTAGMGINNKTPKDMYIELFQETLNQQFANATDYQTIKEEIPFASNNYQDVNVRVVTHVVTSETGSKNGDDYKKILFQDIGHATGQGYYYNFNSNYWLVINSDSIKNLAATCVVQRCNNVLRWIDRQGGYHAIPCAITELIKENRDYSTSGSSVVLPAAQ